MECIECKASNPEGKRYCGDCGALLDPNSNPPRDFLDDNFRQHIQTALKEQFKDQKVVEVEITEAIVTRLVSWAKLFGFFVGIPLGLLALIAGFLGYNTYSGFLELITTTQQEIKKNLREEGQNQADAIRDVANKLKAEYQGLESHLSELKALDQKVGNLAREIVRIEERIGFKPSAALTPTLKEKLKSSLDNFQLYLTNLGFKFPEGEIEISIDSKPANNAWYLSEENRIILGENIAQDTNVVIQMYAQHALHFLLDSTLGKSDQTRRLLSGAIASGTADYLTCSFSNDPLLGNLRNLKNDKDFSDVSQNTNIYEIGEIWGGTFWEIRELLGKDTADKLLAATWTSLQLSDMNKDIDTNFVKRLLKTAQSLEADQHADQVRSILERRKLL